MAIQRSYRDEYGSTHGQAYHRIIIVQLQPTKAQVQVAVYHNRSARDEDAKPLEVLFYNASTKDPAPSPDDPPVDTFTSNFTGAILASSTRDPQEAAYKTGYAYVKAQGLTGTDV